VVSTLPFLLQNSFLLPSFGYDVVCSVRSSYGNHRTRIKKLNCQSHC
jgi:hypothetical protein